MNRFLLSCSIALLLAACSDCGEMFPNPSNPKEKISQKNETHRVEKIEAITRAEKFLSIEKMRSQVRVVKSCEYYVAHLPTRSMVDTIEVAFYLINYENDEGFALVSADERATDVYAYSTSGQLLVEDLKDNPGWSNYMEMAVENYQAEVRTASFQEPTLSPEITPVTPTIPNEVQLYPLVWYNGALHHRKTEVQNFQHECVVPTKWHQSSPYNIFTSPYVAGCAVLAITQIMAYHEHPESYDNYTYDWDLINASAEYFSEDDLAAIQISRLNWQVGKLGSANYRYEDGQYSTSMSAANAKRVFNLMGYTCSEVSEYTPIQIVRNIESDKPIWVAGYSSQKGHAWVIDGCRYEILNHTYYKAEEPFNKEGSKSEYGSFYYRCNWGWKDDDSVYCLSLDEVKFRGFVNNMQVIYDIAPN